MLAPAAGCAAFVVPATSELLEDESFSFAFWNNDTLGVVGCILSRGDINRADRVNRQKS
jgi:hypothetical protein